MRIAAALDIWEEDWVFAGGSRTSERVSTVGQTLQKRMCRKRGSDVYGVYRERIPLVGEGPKCNHRRNLRARNSFRKGTGIVPGSSRWSKTHFLIAVHRGGGSTIFALQFGRGGGRER